MAKDAKSKTIRPDGVGCWLPYPPTVNHYFKRGRGGHVYLSREAVTFREEVAKRLEGGPSMPILGPLHLTIEVYPPDKRKRDLDNVLKCLLDACQHGGLYKDDAQVKEIHAKMWPKGDKAGVRLAAWPEASLEEKK